jgi:hypothetical protein
MEYIGRWSRWGTVGKLSRSTFRTLQELMKLTRNKRRFYQEGIRAATLIRSSS